MSTLHSISQLIDRISRLLGHSVSYMTLALVLMQISLVVMSAVFNTGSIMMQESLLYFHSMIFLGGASYTLLQDAHVRVDVFYSRMSPQAKQWVNIIGCLVFLMPVCGIIGYYAWDFVMDSWDIREGSIESSGLQIVYILKSMIVFFVFTVLLQSISEIIKSILTLKQSS